ncbi:beta-xylosidase [Lachnotalea glycerini]|uniref:Beta-xylosidase n=1 Tax=Lachnotalea glycerini TaxID=1763509 RepID=A0A318EKU1_9FIRM|nr:helix-turn-helix domain-containing protein [Lachnotalea glycerini]PXV84896.1 beta-xylosidase [Lachnotalea glycerini]
MENDSHELIHYDADIPIRFFISKLSGYETRHWHSSCEIILVLSGQLVVNVDDLVYTLNEDDLIVINGDAIHDLKSEACEIILLHMDLERIYYNNAKLENYFVCCSTNKKSSYADYNYIRYLLARIIQTNSDIKNNHKTMAIIYTLLNELNTSFCEIHSFSSHSDKHNERIRMITKYIKHHFRENVTLSDLAQNQNLSVSYLSKFFEKHMHTNFIHYYNSIKLEHAVNELLSSDATIENIAVNNGFSDSRSFVSAFKKNYGIRPSEYRKNYVKNNCSITKPILSSAKWTYINLNDTAKLEKLGKYLKLFDHEIPESDYQIKTIDCGSVDFNAPLSILHHYYRSMLTVNSAKLLLYESVRDMIRKAQSEIGFQYISFNSLLSDDMMIYHENAYGDSILSFTYVNEILDFIIGQKLKPFIRLNYIPRDLANNTSKTVYFKKDFISKPKDMNKWILLVEKLFLNFIQRYGLKEVSSWPVNIWNEPAASIFSFDDEEDFFFFYTETFCIIKQMLPTVKIGTPPMTFLNFEWFQRFNDYIKSKNCTPDYIDLHYYDDAAATNIQLEESFDKSLFFSNLSQYDILNNLNTDPNAFFFYLNKFKNNMKELGYGKLPHYLSEWNLTLSCRNRINDTCFKSCYLTKNLLENYDRLQSFGYWSITDRHEEMQIPSSLYHGGFGLLTMNGVPKASYNVLRLMKRLGSRFLGRGDGWFVTKEDNRIIIVYYNYEHYSKLFASGKLFDMTNSERYIPFSNEQDAIAKITLSNLPGRRCTIKEFFVNRNYGSSFDNWVRMGAESLNEEDLALLKATSSEGLYIHNEEILGGHLTITSVLEPLEVRMLEIEIIE